MQAGLIIEGNSTGSAILRLPKIPETLGPIKCKALRVARRVSNLLRAGYPVSDYESLEQAGLILLRVPDAAVPRIVEELAASELALKGLSFLLCESWLPADVLNVLRASGASVATLVKVPEAGRNWFVIEGEPHAVRLAKRFIEMNESRALEIRRDTKQLYFAAALLSTALPVPLFLAARKALRASGISGNHLPQLLNEMAQSMFREFSKGARVRWGGPLAECSADTARRHLEALRLNDPELADLVAEQLNWARRRMIKAKASGI
ncbi:MAG: DUF2520 domain-containing protein [Acidobacteriaceae bacterium]|nr:DUF2520 domain-containing protein [Acidobacteriaceae bacterium]